ncbi:MAG: c-type cytochrome biogenesis protein CcmI [Methylobacteriaceae bacterium]|nr:c-type cytochrome biogenesis protein CcmI [Methylobacteriaceae bacterium]MBV9244303.1 c-type cytochrome biogenesis protein CcmI [Methylobacteriaceae bacterium]
MIWVVFALMTGVALICVLWPLASPRVSRSRATADVTFYREQLAEIDRDASGGLIAPADVAVARAETARRLLRAGEEREREGPAHTPPKWRQGAAAAFALVTIPAVALGLYVGVPSWFVGLGSPDLPDAPLEARLNASLADMDVSVAIARLEARLAKHPDDGMGQEVIAKLYLAVGRADEAAAAYAKALELLGETPQRREDYGEALVAAANGVVTADARAAFETTLRADPSRPKARYYLGLAAEQAGDGNRAVEIFSKLVAEAPNAPWAAAVRARLAALGAASPSPGAGAAAEIAALPPADRDAAIRGMVDQLAARLARDGHDAEGWLKLVRSYVVMNETDKARAALLDARRSLAEDSAALARLDDLARELGLGGS